MITKSSEQSPFLTLGLSQAAPKKEFQPHPSESGLALPERIAEWNLEPELTGPVPRRTVLRSGYVAGAVLCAVFFLGLVLLSFSYRAEHVVFGWPFLIPLGVMAISYFAAEWERRLSRLLVSSGTATRGIVVERTYLTSIHGGHVEYVIAYDTPARRYISFGIGESKVGDALTVLYLPEAPDQAMPYRGSCYKAVASQEDRSA